MDSICNSNFHNIAKALIIMVLFLIGCSYKRDVILKNYIINNCDFSTDKICVVNFCDIYNIQFDTAYLFDGYSFSECEDIFIHGKVSTLSGGFLLGDEDKLLVLTKGGEIVKRIRIPNQFFSFDLSQTLSQNVIFDDDTLLIYAKMYPKSIFSIEQKNDGYYRIY